MNLAERWRIDGRRALVTGGTRGLGLAMARALGQAGASVVLASRDPDHLGEAREALTAEGIDVAIREADLATPAGAERFCDDVLGAGDPIDILINNVGGRRVNDPTESMPTDRWRQIIDLNLTQLFICTKRLGGAMLGRGWGRVINIGSISGLVAGKQMRGRSYETSKAAVAMFTKSVAADWAASGVTVNAIAPGTFLTDANARWFRKRPELKDEIEATIPMGRLGDPEEIGPLAVFLASDAASYMTGAVVVIDGGRTLW